MHRRHPAESEENPSMKKGNLDAFFEEKGLTENTNNAPLPVPQARPEEKPLDRVKEPPARRRSREREDR